MGASKLPCNVQEGVKAVLNAGLIELLVSLLHLLPRAVEPFLCDRLDAVVEVVFLYDAHHSEEVVDAGSCLNLVQASVDELDQVDDVGAVPLRVLEFQGPSPGGGFGGEHPAPDARCSGHCSRADQETVLSAVSSRGGDNKCQVSLGVDLNVFWGHCLVSMRSDDQDEDGS